MTATKKVDLIKTPWKTIPTYAFGGASIETLLLPEGITSIGVSAFESTRIRDELVLPDTVTTIGANAFSGDKKTNFNKACINKAKGEKCRKECNKRNFKKS